MINDQTHDTPNISPQNAPEAASVTRNRGGGALQNVTKTVTKSNVTQQDGTDIYKNTITI